MWVRGFEIRSLFDECVLFGSVLRYEVVPSGSGQDRVDITGVTYSIVCCLLVYFTTRGLTATWLFGTLIFRNFELLWYHLLSCTSAIRLLTTQLLALPTISLLDVLTVRFFAT